MIFFKNLSTLPEFAMLKTFLPDHEYLASLCSINIIVIQVTNPMLQVLSIAV
jgi:hypothetical protein